MEEKIKILILEDLSSDVELAERELKTVLNNYKIVVADTEQGFIKALENFKPDLIISDYMLPSFNGMKALQITRKKDEYIPFIILTGSMNEETAVECMKSGADDYVIKEGIKRLGPAILGALDKKKIRQERTQAEEALRKSEAKFRSYIENSPDGIFITNEEGKYIEVNKAACEITGYSEDELLKLTIPELIQEEYSEIAKNHFQTLVKEGFTSGELGFVTKSGEKRFWSVDTVKLSETRFLGFAKDITERKQAEEALASSEEKLRILFESAPDAYYINDLKGNFIDGNKAAEKILGYNREELIRKNFAKLNLLSSKDLPTALATLAMNALGKSTGPDEFTLRRKDGVLVSLEIRTHPVKIAGKRVILGIARDITERKLMEEVLKETKSNLQALLDNRKDSIWSLDRDCNFIVFNKPYADVIYSNLGVRLKKGMNAFEIHPKEVNDFWKPKFDEVLNGNYVTFEFPYVLDGKEHFFEVFMNPIYTDGEITGLSALSMDITERKQAEEQIRQSALKWQSTFNSITDIILVISKDHKIIEINHAGCEALGLEHDDIIGKKCFEIVHGTESPIKECPCVCVFDSKKMEFSEYTHNGRHYLLTAWPILDEDGNVDSSSHSIKDITERKQAEAALKESEERFRKAFTTSPDSININRLEDGLYVSINDGFTKITGYTESDVIGKTSLESNIWGNPEDRVKLVEGLRKHGQVKNLEAQFRMKDGKVVYGLMSAAVITLDGVPHIISITRDITERKQAEEQIKKDLKEKEILLKEVHHRVKNNLAVLSSLVNLQSRQIHTEQKAKDAFTNTRDRIHAIASVHERIYKSDDFTKIDLQDYVKNLVSDLMRIYRGDVEISHDLEVANIKIDLTRAVPCGLLLNELVTNALKHAFKASKKGRLTIGMDIIKDGRVRLLVEDNGVGLPEKYRSGKAGSLGMELISILTQQLDGEMDVRVKNGTAFTITFPVSDE